MICYRAVGNKSTVKDVLILSLIFDRLVLSVVNQYYEAQVYDVFVIKGNTAVFKCHIPSFVSDHVEVIAWQDTGANKYLMPSAAGDYGTWAHITHFPITNLLYVAFYLFFIYF